jgi:predicted transcriptional regulator
VIVFHPRFNHNTHIPATACIEIMTSALSNSVRDRALELLGDGLSPSIVASALGVSESAISQYLSQDEFKQEVLEKRYEALASNNKIDRRYTSLEERVLDKLDKSIDMIYDPMKLAGVLRTLNGAVRRGSAAPQQMTEQKTAVTLNMPTFVLQRYTTQVNINNQVVAVVDESGNKQSLVTIQSKTLSDMMVPAASSEPAIARGTQSGEIQDAIPIASPSGPAYQTSAS